MIRKKGERRETSTSRTDPSIDLSIGKRRNSRWLIFSETVDGYHKEAREKGSRKRISAGWETVRGGMRDHRLETTGGDNLVQGTKKTAETHHGEKKK